MPKQVSVAYMICGLIFTVCLIVSNIVEQKLITIFGVECTAGLLIFPVSYIINDLIAEVWGYRKARFIIWNGFLLNFLVVIVFQLSIAMPGSPHFSNQQAFESILGNTTRIVIASFIAFLCGSFLNAYVMSRMKILQRGKGFSLRAIASTIIGEGADSLIFFSIAFWGIVPVDGLLKLILTQTLLKTAYEVIALPLTNIIVRKVKKMEHTDVYDNDISYNPLKVRDV